MARKRRAALAFKRFTHRTRIARKNIRRAQWRKRQKQQKKQLTPAERKAAHDSRRAAKEAINDALGKARTEVWSMAERLFAEFKYRTVRWWYDMIIISARKTSVEREMNRWNVFLFLKTKERAQDPDAPILKVNELSSLLREEWNALTPAERIALTEDAAKELQEVRDMKKFSLQNAPIAAFLDSDATLDRVSTELDQLCMRTELEFMLIGGRTNSSHYNKPYVYTTNQRVDDYFELRCGMSLEKFAKGLECFLLSGIDGAVNNAHDELNKLKARAADIILTKLQEAAEGELIKKMRYKDFTEFITTRYRIVIDNWPLKNFVPPGSLSKPELTILINAWENELTKFRRLTAEEFETWKKAQELPPPAQEVSSSGTTAEPPIMQNAAPTSGTSPPSPSSSHHTLSPLSTPLASMTAGTSAAVASSAAMGSSSTAVFSVASNTLVQKKTRKKRSDAGVKRGPNNRSKKKGPEGHEVASSSTR